MSLLIRRVNTAYARSITKRTLLELLRICDTLDLTSYAGFHFSLGDIVLLNAPDALTFNLEQADAQGVIIARPSNYRVFGYSANWE
jgi:hypothetical protein